MKKWSLKTYIELLEKDRDEMIEEIDGLEYGRSKAQEFANWANSTINGLTKELHAAKTEIARIQPFADCADQQAEELDEKDRIIRNLEEQIKVLEENK
jgi:hypothetical protein